MVVGSTDSIPVEKDFIDDPVVEFMEVVTRISIRRNLVFLLEDCLLHHFKPEGTFDPFAKFDGYEGVIELRYLSKASKMIDDFKENQIDLLLAMKNLEFTSLKKLENIFGNYHLNDSKSFGDFYTDYIAKNMPIRKKDFLNSLYELYERNVLFLNEINSYYENELDEMNRSYPLWLQKQIDVMEAYVYETLSTYDSNTTWNKGVYFRRYHPLGLSFDTEKPIVLLQWRGKIEYKRMRTDLIF